MGFREIDNTPGGIVEKLPVEIEVMFNYALDNGEIFQKFLKLQGDDYKSYVFYLDWCDFKEQVRNEKVFDEDGNKFNDETLEIYCKSYSSGFVEGYIDLDKEIRDASSVFQTTNEETAERIFSIIHTRHHPFSGHRNFLYKDETGEEGIPVLTRSILEEDGKKIGRYYKAWFFIVHNPKLFVTRFRSFYIEHYKLIESALKERNKHHKEYRTELQDIIDVANNALPIAIGEQFPFSNPKTFDELFNDLYRNQLDSFVNILRTSAAMEGGQSSLLSEENEWIGNKQAAMVFYEELVKLDIVIKVSNRKAGLLFEAYFKNLDKSFASKKPGDNANDYRCYFNSEIKRIKTKVT